MKSFVIRASVVTALLALAPAVVDAQVKPVPDPPPPPTAQFAVVADLNSSDQGSESLSGLVRGPDGNFYGTANGSGPDGFGTIFSLDPTTNAVTRVYSFNAANGFANGAYPLGLRRSRFGDYLYGTTSMGGANGFGTIYKFTPPNQVDILYSFECLAGC